MVTTDLDALLQRCAHVIETAQRREVPLDRWTRDAQEVLGTIYDTLESREQET